MPRRYESVDECRPLIQRYIKHLERSSDDNDPNKRKNRSTRRYKQDLRWFDHWLDEEGIESATDVTSANAFELGHSVSAEFNGSTSLYRWDRIHSFYDWLGKMGLEDDDENNPLDKWNDEKESEFGISKASEHSKRLRDDESYAVTQDDVRKMEEHVGRPRIRNQLAVRLLWQTGLRRGEASEIRLSDLNRENREITVRASVAKNNKKRVVAYQRTLDGLLRTWIDGGKRDSYNTNNLPYLFIGERGAQLSGDAINDVIIKAADKAGINRRMYHDANSSHTNKEGNRWLISAHNVRHGYGSYLVNEVMPEKLLSS